MSVVLRRTVVGSGVVGSGDSLPTTVLLRTTLTRMIKLHYYMLPPGSNHLLNSHTYIVNESFSSYDVEYKQTYMNKMRLKVGSECTS